MTTAATHQLPPALLDRLTNRLIADCARRGEQVTPDEAARAFADLLAFLASGERVPPSEIVDEAWHTFMLYSRHYYDWCIEHIGEVIHHEPDDERCDVDVCERATAKCDKPGCWGPRCGEDREPAAVRCHGRPPQPRCGRCKKPPREPRTISQWR